NSLAAVLAIGGLGLLGNRWRLRRRRTKRPRSSRPQAELLEGRVVLSTTFTWTEANPKGNYYLHYGSGTMLPYPNGTIMMTGRTVFDGTSFTYSNGLSNVWDVLVPSATGSYVNITDPTFYTSNQSRLYFATNVLPNDQVFLMGGEHSSSTNETNTG